MSELDLLRRLGDQIVPPSLDALRQTARRRTLRTATAGTIAAAAVATVALVGGHLAATDNQPQPPVGQLDDGSRPITYAEDATVHYGDHTVTVPGHVVELDVTDDGVVVRTADDRIWFTDGSGVDQLGAIGESAWGDILWDHYVGRVVSSDSGSEVAWFEFPRPQSPDVVVYDTQAGEVVHRYPVDVFGTGTVAGLYSVDAQAVYGFTDLTFGEELWPNWRIDLATGTQSPQSLKHYQDVLERRGLARTVLVSHQEAPDPASFVPFDGLQQLSVNGTRVRPEGAQPLWVRDGLTGSEFRFAAPTGYRDTNPLWLVQWLDDDTVVLHSEQPDGIDLLECHVSTGECTVALQASSDAVVPELPDPNASTKTSG
jgi:hypothetical protein